MIYQYQSTKKCCRQIKDNIRNVFTYSLVLQYFNKFVKIIIKMY